MLDANVILHLVNKADGYQRIAARLIGLKSNQRAISAIAAFELRHMLIERKVSKEKIDQLARVLARFEALAFTDRAALRAAQVLSDLKRRHLHTGYADVLQAGHALALGRIFVTDNERHFTPVAGLVVENWRRNPSNPT